MIIILFSLLTISLFINLYQRFVINKEYLRIIKMQKKEMSNMHNDMILLQDRLGEYKDDYDDYYYDELDDSHGFLESELY